MKMPCCYCNGTLFFALLLKCLDILHVTVSCLSPLSDLVTQSKSAITVLSCLTNVLNVCPSFMNFISTISQIFRHVQKKRLCHKSHQIVLEYMALIKYKIITYSAVLHIHNLFLFLPAWKGFLAYYMITLLPIMLIFCSRVTTPVGIEILKLKIFQI